MEAAPSPGIAVRGAVQRGGGGGLGGCILRREAWHDAAREVFARLDRKHAFDAWRGVHPRCAHRTLLLRLLRFRLCGRLTQPQHLSRR